MSKKYEFTGETKTIVETGTGREVTVRRIRALREFECRYGSKGGWIEKEENLSQEGECWVSEDAIVCGEKARVFGDAYIGLCARVENDAEVFGHAVVTSRAMVNGRAKVYDFAKVAGLAIIRGKARVFGHATVDGSAIIDDLSKVRDHAHVTDDTEVLGNATIKDDATVCGHAVIQGNAIIKDDAIAGESSTVDYSAVVSGTCKVGGSMRFVSDIYCKGIINKLPEGRPGDKYAFTGGCKFMYTTQTLYGRKATTLRRIIALKDFGKVKKGDIGGWIESEDNLSQKGKCWVNDEAVVCNGATVTKDAQVLKRARILNASTIKGKIIVTEDAELYGDIVSILDGDVTIKTSDVCYGLVAVDGKYSAEQQTVFDKVKLYGQRKV